MEAMARAKLTADWDRTALLASLLHQQFRAAVAAGGVKPGPVKSVFDFHLYRNAPPVKACEVRQNSGVGGMPKLPVSVLKNIFVKPH